MRATQRNHARGPTDDEIKFFSIADVAELVQVAPRTVRRWIKARELVAYKVGGIVRIADRDLRLFLAGHREA
jgi:excisionase family DNA binding protein